MPRTSDAVLERLKGLYPKAIDLSLARIARLLDALGAPQDRLPPVVHVAGTNGKGSVIAFLGAILEEAGHSVHAYTSPHLVSFHERVRPNGVPLAEDRLVELLVECERANRGEPVTFFEITTAAAFLAFSRAPADAVLLETGLGGRLDATNMTAPALSVITPVSTDHTRFLGETVSQIAAEKAGILKPGVPAVIGPQTPAARLAIRHRAAAVGAPLFEEGRDWRVERIPGGFRYMGEGLTLDLPRPALVGDHQVDNAGIAVACVERLTGFRIPYRAVARGLRRAVWPGRLQRLTEGALVNALRGRFELWLDGAHNEAAAAALAAWARGEARSPLHLVCGMMQSKDADSFVRRLAPFAASLRAVPIPGEPNAFPAEEVWRAARDAGLPAACAKDTRAALADIAAHEPPRPAGAASGRRKGRVLVCGSLYLVGAALAENGREASEAASVEGIGGKRAADGGRGGAAVRSPIRSTRRACPSARRRPASRRPPLP